MLAISKEGQDVENKTAAKQVSSRRCINKQCSKSFDSLKRKCDSCGSIIQKVPTVNVRVTTHQRLLNRSFDFDVTEHRNSSTINMGEPILVNPNNYDSVRKVLHHMKDLLITGGRHWTFLGSDGPPFCLASRIIENNLDKYSWVSMLSGLEHLHMNQLKSFFKVVDQIFLEPLGKEILGFQSPKAYDFFVNAKDTHKAFQSLTILLEGTAAEFYSMYLKENKGEISGERFLNWADNNPNETVHLIFQLIFTFALAIYVVKFGVRCNNVEMIEAGRLKFLPLFYGFRHSYYQEVEYRELFNRVTYPQEVLKFVNDNMTFTSSELEKNHQGGDFCLENKIKRLKMIAPKGRISNSTWQTLCRGIDKIERVYENAAEILQIDDGEKHQEIDLYDEIVSWRAVLRSSHMLECRLEEGIVKNIYGEVISMEVDDLAIQLENKMDRYWQKAREGIPLSNITTSVIPIFPDNEDCNFSESSCDETDD